MVTISTVEATRSGRADLVLHDMWMGGSGVLAHACQCGACAHGPSRQQCRHVLTSLASSGRRAALGWDHC